jgi:hypothetical protein
VIFKVAASGEHFRTERAPMSMWELAKEAVEMELTERRGGVLTALAMKKGKVARVHPGVLGRGERRDLSIQSLACRGVGGVFVDEVRFETIPVWERLDAKEAVMSRLVSAGVSVIVGPARFGSDE